MADKKHVLIDYAFHSSNKYLAVLSESYGIYLFKRKTQDIIPGLIFQSKQYKARGIQFNPCLPNVLVVWGQSGLIAVDMELALVPGKRDKDNDGAG